MNTYLFASVENVWLLTGWTMIHFLWLGALVALAALVSRWLLRRTSANVRYATSLTFLALLAALPIIIATWLHQNPASFKGQARAGFVGNEEQIRDTTLSKTAPIDLAALEPRQNFDAPMPAETPPAIARTSEVSPAAPTRAPAASDPLALAISILNASVSYLPWLWLIGTPITFALTATGLIGTRRLRLSSSPITDGPIAESLEKLAASLRLTRRVAVAVCDRIAAPVLIGILRPIILLPPAALTGYSPDEIEMVLLHELAHVRRWDNLVNLIQRLVESLLFFHPAVWLISSWVRRERETCCDALVVTRTDRPHAYAELLVALAAQMPRSVLFHPAASSAMAAGPLRSRIRRILKLDDDPMLISGKSFAAVLAALLLTATLAVLYLPTIGQAEQSQAKAHENIDAATPAKTNVLDKEHSEKLATRDSLQKKLQELQGDIKRKYEEYIEVAHHMGGSQLSPRDPDIDLHLRDIADSQKKVEVLTTGYYQLQTDYMVAKRELSDPALFEAQANEAIKQDSQFANLQQQLRNAREAPSSGSDSQIESINRKIEQYRADFKRKAVREMQNKPSVPLQQLTQRFKTQADSIQKQIALATQNLEQKRKELEKRVGKSIDLEKRGEELRKLQQIANDMSVKLEDLDVDAGGPEQIRQPQTDDWPAGIAFPSPKEGEISIRAWRELGIKVIPANKGEQAGKGGHALKVVGGVQGPPGNKAPLFLLSIGNIETNKIETNNYDDLDSALNKIDLNQPVILECVINTENGPLWIKSIAHKKSSDTNARRVFPDFHVKFPSLEDQKLADLAWKRLGLELEPINEEEMKRVKALGYEGGLRLSGSGNAAGTAPDNTSLMWQWGDILVGLHVWPTTTLKDVGQILNRDDIAELNPLKFYVVSKETVIEDPSAPAKTVTKDVVRTGRIKAWVDESRSSRIPANRQPMLQNPRGNGKGTSAPTPDTPFVAPDSTYSASPTPMPGQPRSGLQPAPNPYIPRVTIAPQSTLPKTIAEPAPANTPTTKPIEPQATPSPHAPVSPLPPGGRSHVTLTPAQSVFVAYNIPPELKDNVLRYFGKFQEEVRSMPDDRGRYIVQAARAWHDNFVALLKAAPKWRDPAAAKERAAAPVIMKKIDDEDILEWRSVGLSLKRNTEPRPLAPAGQASVVVAEVTPGSPAAWADIRPGDVLNEIGSFRANTMPEVQSLITALGEGFQSKKRVLVTFLRETSHGILVVTADFTLGPEDLGAKPAEPQTSKPPETKSRPAEIDKANFRYEGKTFREWRNAWQSELSLEKRTEAVKALAAFGSRGYGPEASEAILDVAQEYDSLEYGDSPEGRFGNAVRGSLTVRIPKKDWLPLLRKRYDAEPQKWVKLALDILPQCWSNDEHEQAQIRQFLLLLTQDANSEISRRATEGFDRLFPESDELKKHPPKIVDLLLHDDPKRQLAMRKFFYQQSGRSSDKTVLIENLVDILKDDTKKADHLAAIRALGAIGGHGSVREGSETVRAVLRAIVDKGPRDQQIAAAVALSQLIAGNPQAFGVRAKIELRDSDGKKLTPEEIDALLIKESETAVGQAPRSKFR